MRRVRRITIRDDHVVSLTLVNSNYLTIAPSAAESCATAVTDGARLPTSTLSVWAQALTRQPGDVKAAVDLTKVDLTK
jgi:hypothetical protein